MVIIDYLLKKQKISGSILCMYELHSNSCCVPYKKPEIGRNIWIGSAHWDWFCCTNINTKLFADLGANIGMYTVTVANLGRKVVAVDAGLQNLAYIDQSLQLNGNRENVTLVNNAIR